ncbi:NAD(P)-binding protein [Astrocystis sublimbata]|nr:NAD(P)-binding protein [Astrocystis sublimbata]
MDVTGAAFVTGGGSGIGKACCFEFAKQGARGLVVADLNLQTAKSTATDVVAIATNPEFKVEAIELDVSDEESVKKAIEHTLRSFGRIDYSVHCAGVPGGTFDPVAEANFTDFKRLLDVNVNGIFLVTSLVSKAMKNQEAKPVDREIPAHGNTRGAVVNLSSVSSYISVPNMVQYTTSKHAVLGITKTAAIDNVAHDIRVNCVCPSWTDTPMVQTAMEVVPGLEESFLEGVPMGRLARPEEVANVAIFLCSPKSSFMTGTSLIVDGGMSLACKT